VHFAAAVVFDVTIEQRTRVLAAATILSTVFVPIMLARYLYARMWHMQYHTFKNLRPIIWRGEFIACVY
jgi:hypothetical protein